MDNTDFEIKVDEKEFKEQYHNVQNVIEYLTNRLKEFEDKNEDDNVVLYKGILALEKSALDQVISLMRINAKTYYKIQLEK